MVGHISHFGQSRAERMIGCDAWMILSSLLYPSKGQNPKPGSGNGTAHFLPASVNAILTAPYH